MSRPVNFDNVVAEIKSELDDENFKDILHGSHEGLHPTCSGPLCRKYRRDRDRKIRGLDPVESVDEDFVAEMIRQHASKVLADRAREKARRIAS